MHIPKGQLQKRPTESLNLHSLQTLCMKCGLVEALLWGGSPLFPFKIMGLLASWVEHSHVQRCWAKGSAGGPLLVWHLRDPCATQAGNLCCASGTPSAPGLGRHWAVWRLLRGFPQRWSGWVVGAVEDECQLHFAITAAQTFCKKTSEEWHL